MTQSGQGEEPQLPAARPAHEGVVLPADGGGPVLPGAYAEPASPAVPAGGQPWGQPWGPQSPPAQAPESGPVGGQAWGTPQGAQPLPPAAQQQPAFPPAGADADATQYIPPVPGQSIPGQSIPGQPLPPVQPQVPQAPSAHQAPTPPHQAPVPPHAPYGDEAATQMIPPVMGNLPEMGPGGQQLPPQHRPGALPPEQPAESTYLLGRQQAVDGPDAQATQYLPPVPPTQDAVPPAPSGAPYGIRPGAPGDRQPPAEFDSLFRSEPAEGSADSTQQMPRFTEPAPAPRAHHGQDGYGGHGGRDGHGGHGGRGGQGGRAAARRDEGGGPTRGRVLAVVGVGIAVVGIAAGALMGLIGGGDDDGAEDPAPAGATGPAEKESSAPAADPAKAQAVALDKLLADSNNSRDAVIRSVEAIKSCKNLGQAAQDLRDAAGQRNSLVTRLDQLEMDKLPQHQQLRSALDKAWKASASADSHYASWADQVAAKKGCPKGRPRTTSQFQEGNRSSGDATTAKREAAPLWNTIAKQWGLTERSPQQL